VLALVGVYSIAGPAAVAGGAAILIVLATCLRLTLQEVRTRRASEARVEVAQACSALASQIQVGRTPTEALRSTAADCPVLAEASETQQLGGDVTSVWRDGSLRPGQGGLTDLARAWQVSTQTGAPLAPSLQQVGASLTADVALRTVIAAELAAPRASGKIMAVLPFCGLGMGYLLGGDPVQFLFSSPYGWVCLVLGVALAAAGVLWIDRLSRLAAEAV
jgi:tight adherence protein B